MSSTIMTTSCNLGHARSLFVLLFLSAAAVLPAHAQSRPEEGAIVEAEIMTGNEGTA